MRHLLARVAAVRGGEGGGRMTITTQRELRRVFWAQHPGLPRRRILNYSGNGTMYPTDTRVAFVEWLDAMQKAGEVNQALAERATLEAEA